jgi:hypothetical protein
MFKLQTIFRYLTGQAFILYMDSGGSSNTGGGTQIQELPEWARPYAKATLEKGAALSEKGYQAYNAPRIAGFSPMQLQAQQQAAGMQTSGATGAGIDIAGEAALRGLGQNYQGGQFEGGRFGGQQAAQYMSPFIEQALAPQLREAQRSSDIMGQQQAAQAVGRGAFGGSRDALMRAERERNLGMQMGDIRARGLQDAYTQAASQFNADQQRAMQAQQLGEQSRQFGANIGMQGLQTALTGAGQLGALGGQQFQQGMDINKLQSAYGGQQQALRQQGLSQAYEDFQNEQNYPYKQLGFMSDLIRGLPLGQQTTRTMYEPNPGAAQQIGALGMGAYGLSKFMAEGGLAYAGGGSVDSPDNVERIVSQLSDQQLQQSAQAAQARGDMDQLEAIQSEMAMRASERRGIAGGITNQMAERMAGGGVVAFKMGGVNDYMKNVLDASNEDLTETPEQRLAGIKGALPGIQSLYGESAMKPFMEELKKDREGLGKQKNMGEGLAFLAGADALMRPGSKSRAVTSAFAAIGGGLAKAEKDFTDANAKLRQSEMTLAAAEQARADGQIGKAESMYDKGMEGKKEAVKRKIDANEKLATIQASVDNSIRSANAQLASVNKPGETERMLAELDEIRTGKKTFQGLTGEKGAQAYQDSVSQLGAARYGVKYTGPNKEFDQRKAVLELMQKDEGVKIAQMKVAQLEAKEKLTPKEQAALDANNSFLKKRYDSAMSELQKSGGPAAAAEGAGGKVMTMADVLRTAQDSGKTVEEVRAAAARRGYTIQ